MPIDINLAKSLIKFCSLHRSHPGGERMEDIQHLLEEVVKEQDSAALAVRTANAGLVAAERALADERASLSEINQQHDRLVAMLTGVRQIAEGVKAPKKFANDLLAANGFADKTEAPADAAKTE